jgi:hypothetical protein
VPAGNPVRSIKTPELLQSHFLRGEERTGWLVMCCCWVAEQIVFPFFLTHYKGCVCSTCERRGLAGVGSFLKGVVGVVGRRSELGNTESELRSGKRYEVCGYPFFLLCYPHHSSPRLSLPSSAYPPPLELPNRPEVSRGSLILQRQQMTNTFKSVDS